MEKSSIFLPSDLPGTLASSVYERLRGDIVRGRLAPGEKLRIEALRLRYGVGASPLREALNRLAAEGLVGQADQRGFHVPPVSLEDLEELTRTRVWIYEVALRESVARGDAAWEEAAILAFHRLSRTPRRLAEEPGVTSPEWEQRHRAFHSALIAACGSRWLLEFAEALFDRADRYRHLSIAAPGPATRDVLGEHRAIMDAALARDAPAAIGLLAEHLSRTAGLAASGTLRSPQV